MTSPTSANLKVRSLDGGMVPLGSVATLKNDTGPVRVVRYNLFPAAEIQGAAAPACHRASPLTAMENYAKQALPEGFKYEWTEIALQEKIAGQHRPHRFPDGGGARLSRAGCPV